MQNLAGSALFLPQGQGVHIFNLFLGPSSFPPQGYFMGKFFLPLTSRVGKNPVFFLKPKPSCFFGFYCFCFFGFYCFFFWFLLFFFLGFIMFFFYFCVFKLFLTRKKKITVQLSEYCGCHYACAEQDVRFLTQHVHL